MFRRCKSTGKVCQYDPTTHRCRCGNWQRGHKPKCEPVRLRAECQICERIQALESSGYLGHHGYTRPGYGFIQGDCFGVGYIPYPGIDALELYLVAVRGYLERCETQLKEYMEAKELTYIYKPNNHLIGSENRPFKEVKLTPDSEGGYNFDDRHTLPTLEEHRRKLIAHQESQIHFAKQDIERVNKRIVKAKSIVS